MLSVPGAMAQELTAAAMSGILQFTFPGEAALSIDLKHTLRWKCIWASLRKVDDYTLVGSKLVNGWNPDRHVFFAARFSEPVDNLIIYKDGKPVIYNTNRFRSSMEVRSMERGTMSEQREPDGTAPLSADSNGWKSRKSSASSSAA